MTPDTDAATGDEEFDVVVTDDWRQLPLDDFEMGLEPLYEASGVPVRFDESGPLEERLRGVDAAIVGENDLITHETLPEDGRLRIVGRLGSGFDNYDLEACTDHGVVATHAPQGPTESVAQGVVGMLVACAHNFVRYNRLVREQGFEDRFANIGVELKGKTLGIVGMGRIGRAVREKLRPFDLDVLAYDPYAEASELPADTSLVDLDELLASSDFVTLHVPLTDETRGMLTADSFRRMKESAYLLNTTRGGMYNDETLARAIREGWIAGAAIDVFEDEPDVEDNPLLELEDCLLTPHISGVTVDSLTRIGNILAECVLAVHRGELPDNILNPDVYGRPVPEERLSPSYRS
jgi:D-3-phosphoglycerate dehydrogenase